jgi:hypothetical protein
MLQNTPSSPKFKRLVRRLRESCNHPAVSLETICVGILELLWHETARHASQGDIGKFSNSEIAEALGWIGDENVLIQSLIDTEFIDKHPDHRLVVHGWADHCPNFVKAKLRRLDLPFACGTEPDEETTQAYDDAEDGWKQFRMRFWPIYPKRNGYRKGKKEAQTKFMKLSQDDRRLCCEAVQAYAASKPVSGVQDPHRWLRDSTGIERWRGWIPNVGTSSNKYADLAQVIDADE